MKGIILAGGAGSRMWPATKVVSKQLIPVGLQPLIYYPICTLMLAGLREILVITTPAQGPLFRAQLEDGSQWGVRFTYAEQPDPGGLGQAFTIAEDAGFLGDGEGACLVLGDNIFDAAEFGRSLSTYQEIDGGLIFAYHVGLERASQFGVVEFDQETGRVRSVVEKPERPTSPFMVPGLYFFDGDCLEHARRATPSARGEVEITSVMQPYIEQGRLRVVPISRSEYWLDTGTETSIEDAWSHVGAKRRITNLRIGVPEEVAWRSGWLTDTDLLAVADENDPDGQNPYANYLRLLVQDGQTYRR
ncbi:MAG: glucose-phosphate thymidylyltransferase [Ilumatobacteraceae bacterium]|nr:glucose-phosphate thymidylyltransferase [Ilumatobacteraceae bacterium]